MDTETKKVKSEIPVKAKTLSNISKVLALVFVLGAFIGYLVFSKELPSSDEAKAIIFVGMFVAGVFLPVDFSLLVKNIKGIQ